MTESAVLILSGDDRLLTDLGRLAAAAGVAPDLVRDPGEGIRRWSPARMILVGADLVGELARLRPPRRERVHVVGDGGSDPPFREALECGAESVLALPAAEGWLIELLTDAGDGSLAQAKTVGVVGGAGGAGATVFATALAMACAARGPAALIDADVLGAGVDHVLGLEAGEGVRWDALVHATGRLGARSLRESLPARGALSVLAWPADRVPAVDHSAAREVLSAARRGFEVVVLDLPRYPHLLAEELLPRCDLNLLVSTCTVPGVAAAGQVAGRLPAGRTRLVLRGGGIEPEQVGAFLDLPIVVSMADQRGLDEALSLGAGPLRHRRGPLARGAHRAAALVRGES
jgi:secretion/DNA translocation related CpaE-like protein